MCVGRGTIETVSSPFNAELKHPWPLGSPMVYDNAWHVATTRHTAPYMLEATRGNLHPVCCFLLPHWHMGLCPNGKPAPATRAWNQHKGYTPKSPDLQGGSFKSAGKGEWLMWPRPFHSSTLFQPSYGRTTWILFLFSLVVGVELRLGERTSQVDLEGPHWASQASAGESIARDSYIIHPNIAL